MDREDIERLARVETTLETIAHAILGNGQPGFIATTNSRIGDLERYKAENSGVFRTIKWMLGAVGGFVAAFGGALINHLWKGTH